MNHQEAGACRAVATAAGESTYSLRFELHHPGAAAIELAIHEPFTAFTVLATADGKPLTVQQPALDIPVIAATVRLQPGTTVTLATPIRLRIAEGAAPGTDGFVWTIARAREAVSLRIELDLPAPFSVVCPVVLL